MGQSSEVRVLKVTNATPADQVEKSPRAVLTECAQDICGHPSARKKVEVEDTGGPGANAPKEKAIPSLDANSSPEQLAKAGVIKDKTKEGLPVTRERAAAGDTPQLTVRFSDSKGVDAKNKPDFVVDRDGKINMLNDPEKNPHKTLVVELQRNNGQLKPTDVQQKALDELYKYLDARIKNTHPDAATNGVTVDDPAALLPKDLEQQLNAKSANPDTEPDSSYKKQMEDMERFRGTHRGEMSRREADNYFPERSVPLQDNETQRIAAMKDVVGGFVSRGDAKPYEHIAHRGDRGWGVGRYGLTYDMVSDWAKKIDLKELQKQEEAGKVPKGTVQRMRRWQESIARYEQSHNEDDLDPFLKKLKAGNKEDPITADEINENFGKELQEMAATHQTARFSQELAARNNGKVDPGELALAMRLGHVPTAEELQDVGNKRFVEAARQAYDIANNRYEWKGDFVPFADTSTLTRAMLDSVGQALWADYAGATQGGNLGCAITVCRMLQKGGVKIGDHLDVNGVAGAMARMGAQRVSLDQAILSGRPYVIIKKVGGSHTGMGVGRTVVENSSGARRVVQRDIGSSSLRSGSYAYIVPTKNGDNNYVA